MIGPSFRRIAGLCGPIVVASLALGCEGRPRLAGSGSESAAHAGDASSTGASLDKPSVAEIDLSHGVPEAGATSLFGASSHHSHADLVAALHALAESSSTKGVLVKFGGASIGLARSQEIGDLLGAIRRSNIPVVCHADDYDNATLFLASQACDRIWVSPAGGVEAVGISAQLVYARSLLDKFHVGVDFLQVGKYKGAEEPFTRDGPSPEARASLEGTLRGLRTAWISGVTKGRGKPELEGALEDGPFTPNEALQRGFVDAVGYFDQAKDEAKKRADSEHVVTRWGSGATPLTGGKGFASMVRAISGSSASAPRISVLVATGAITMNASRSLPFGSSDGISERELGKQIVKLTNDENVKAVVVRIDSPGGSALASDLLWNKLMKLREKKKLVFSVGGMAASGGYYLACTGHTIVAEPTSIVGSIGVVGGKLAFGKALEEYGVHAATIAASPDPEKAARASYMSPFDSWDDATRARVLASMTAVYELFLERVATGRGAKVDRVAKSAEGQIFGGAEAKERGLVDELGGLSEALQIAREKASLPADTPVVLVGEAPGLFELLDANAGGDDEAGDARALAMARRAEKALEPGLEVPELAGFIGSVSPLLAGERALTALPFGLTVR